MEIKQRIASILQALNQGLVERREAMNVAFLSAIAGESVFLLGPPGVAKSLIARRLKFAFKDSQAFEYLMNRFSTPDEIFGPISIKKLKDEDKYERVTNRYLPGANIVFLDEIWKAGPSIQNSLLTVLNEKVYRNGEQEVKVNLRGIVSASNELPAEGQGLDALWDRFLFRMYVQGVQNKDNFSKMITDIQDLLVDNVPTELKIAEEELRQWSQEIDQVEVPNEVISLVEYLRIGLDDQNKKAKTPQDRIYVSDRRWKKIVRVLRTSAFLNGRSKVDLMDCFLIAHCIWQNQDQIDLVKEIISETIRQHAYSINLKTEAIDNEIKSFEKDVEGEILPKIVTSSRKPVLVENSYYEINNWGSSGGRI